MVTKIYIRNIVKSGVNYLAMRDSNGDEGINELETWVLGGSKVKWELEKQSGIKSISRIWSKTAISKVFKNEPKKTLLKKGFEVESQRPDQEEVEEYNIKYRIDDLTYVTIDPCLRIKPS